MEVTNLVIKEEPEIIVPIIDSDNPDEGDDDDDEEVQSNFSEELIFTGTDANSDTAICPNNFLTITLNDVSDSTVDTIESPQIHTFSSNSPAHLEDDGQYKSQKPASNAKTMRDYRSRIRADPVRYEAYKERERIRNRKRCERRRLERIAKNGRKNVIHDLSFNGSYRKVIRIAENDDTEMDAMTGDDEPMINMKEKSHVKEKRINTFLDDLFADLEKIANKPLPTKEIAISIPHHNKNSSNNTKNIKNTFKNLHKVLPEIDIFINDPNTLARVPINGLPMISDILKESKNTTPTAANKYDSIFPLVSNSITLIPQHEDSDDQDQEDKYDSIVDLTEFSEEGDSEINSNDVLHMSSELEPEIEIFEYPHISANNINTQNSSFSRSHTKPGQSSSSSSSSLTNTRRAIDKNPSGYINSFMSFVTRQMEEEEREINGRAMKFKV